MPRRTPRRRSVSPLRLLALEPRTVPAVSVTDTASALSFVADNAGNSVALRVSGTAIQVSVNGGAYATLANARTDTVTSLTLTGGTGNDSFNLSQLASAMTALQGANAGATLLGGAGNDTLVGLNTADTLDGGAGSDTLTGNGGDDTLRARDGEADALDGGLGRDTAVFDSFDTTANCDVWNPYTPAVDNQKQKVKVLVLNYDAVIPSQGNRHIWEVFGWGSPQVKAQGYEEAIERTSGGAVDIDIVEWRNVNDYPVFTDGFKYTADAYYQARLNNTGYHTTSSADVPAELAAQNVVPLIDAGVVDEVWCFTDHYYLMGGETWMAGPGAYYINGPVYSGVASSRAFAGCGFSYERGVAEMLHNTGHRMENVGNRAWGTWNLAAPTTNWDKFSANVTQSNGVAGVGTTHYPPNATADYDYGNASVVQSWGDSFLDYPTATFTPRATSRLSWSKGTNPDYQKDYLEWYYHRLPRAAGVNADGRQNNWWKYLYDFNNYAAGTGAALPLRASLTTGDLLNLGGADYTFAVAYSSAVPVNVNTLDGNDVRVTGPNGFNQAATLVGVSDATNGTYRVATYRVTAPGGSWDATERGSYTVTVQAGQVADTAGATLAATAAGVFQVRGAAPAELPVEADTKLLLHFNGTLAGAGGQTPTASSGVTYPAGLAGSGAAQFATPGRAVYATAGNINPLAGTVEFWFRPDWAGSSTTTRYLFQAGGVGSGGMLVYYYGPSNLLAFQQWGDDPTTTTVETNVGRGYGTGVSGWTAGAWHHIVAAWDSTARTMSLMVDNQTAWSITDAVRIAAFSGTTMSVGGDSGGSTSSAGTLDEFRIADRSRSAAEVRRDYETAFALTGLSLSASTVALSTGDRAFVRAGATLQPSGTRDVTGQVTWVSSNPAVASVAADGTVRALTAGSATITATLDTLVATSTITVTDSQRPTATLGSTPAVTTPGGTAYDFTVVYADNAAVTVSTIDNFDVRVVGPNGFSQYATRVSVNNTANGTPRTATYRLVPPGGDWNQADSGTYRLELPEFAVSDAGPVWAAATTLGTFAVAIDQTAPTAAAGALPAVTVAGATEYRFTVTYTDNTAVSVASLDGGDVRVTGPNGFTAPVTVFGVSPVGNGTPRTVTYGVSAPGALWDAADNGAYTLTLRPSQVADTAGNFAAGEVVLGTFAAAIPPAVAAVSANDGEAQRSRVTSVTVRFTAAVTFSPTAAGAFTLSRVGGGSVGGFTATTATVGGVTVVTLDNFTGAETQGGSLADGYYRLTVLGNAVTAGGVAMAGNYVLTGDGANGLFRYRGDFDGDGAVDGNDLAALAQGFNSVDGDSNYRWWLDLDGDGAIDGNDLAVLAQRFNTVL